MQPCNPHILWVLCDSITNSVFPSQVLAPITHQLSTQPNLTVTILSFERDLARAQDAQRSLSLPPSLTLILAPRLPFLGTWTLWAARKQFERVMTQTGPTQVIARGPLAGWVIQTGRPAKPFEAPWERSRVTIQARGLAAQELRFSCHYGPCKPLRHVLHRVQQWLLTRLEREVYGLGKAAATTTIQAVSPALIDYVVHTFGAPRERCTLAANDAPPTITPAQRTSWRAHIRAELNIDEQALVYCYSGSAKSWQCIDETISYFIERWRALPTCVLVVYTTEVAVIKAKIESAELPPHTYRVLFVPAQELTRYLTAADIGILLRTPDPVNWVSRPTKALEYRAAGLEIVHNNTIGWLIKEQ